MRIKLYRVHIAVFVVCFFIISLPFYVWDYGWVRHIAELVCLLFFIDNVTKSYRHSIRQSNVVILFLSLIFYLSLRNFDLGNFNSISLILNILLCSVFFVPKGKILEYYDTYKTFISSFFLLSLFVYIVVLWFNIDLPYESIKALNPIKPDNYRAYPFLTVYDSEYGFVKFRFCGPYDEPGVVGTLSAIILYGDKYNLKDYRNIIFLLAGVASFSMFFFVVTIVYFFIFKGRYIVSFIFFAIVASIIYWGRDSEVVKSLVFERFDIYINGGGRTTDLFDAVYSEFIRTPNIFWGVGKDEMAKLLAETGASSYKSVIYGYGIIGFVLVILVWLYFSFSSLREYRNWVIFSFIFLAVFYQRPTLFEPYYYFLFVSIISKMSTYELSINNSNYCNI